MQPQYPTQPMMPQFPQQPAYPVQQGYAQPQAPAYPVQQPAYPVQQGYASQQPQQYGPPAQPLPQGTLDGFFEQPSSGGGPSWKFNGRPIGTSYAGIVARTVTNADVRAQTNNAGVPQTYKDGRPKLVMVVPMQVQPSPEYPDGVAGWWVKGQARDELARAMAEAGAPAGAPEAGAAIRVTRIGERAVPGMNPQLLYRVEYVRPDGVAPVPQQPGAPVQAPVQMPMPQPVAQAAPVQQPMPQPVAVQQAPQQPMPAQQPAPAAAPAGFNEEQAALFARLTGGQPAAV
ncbi:hypothetical protein E0H26_11615 [Micromonospora zingiberis]|uniref:Uncharacterized protein n=1 Tax=Micromonospora zingiberis TaxID=2053011 RepID=A0A4R0GPE8_9ACTN|nr:hypothetical protein [Micromonospora zingiberis]TCB97559.1 hypothetical protein E0H26_11615 [Micromonospora zingiberis]